VNKNSPLLQELPKIEKGYKGFEKEQYHHFINQTYTSNSIWIKTKVCINKEEIEPINAVPVDNS